MERYPLVLIAQILDWLSKEKLISNIGICNDCRLLRLCDEDVWKSATGTCYGLLESLVMPIGVTNALVIFQRYVNKFPSSYLYVFCPADWDDVLIYSEILEEHSHHDCPILSVLQQGGQPVEPQEYGFQKRLTELLGLLVTLEGQELDSGKVSVIEQWPVLKWPHDLCTFIGFGIFYQRCIECVARIIYPVTALTRKDSHLMWSTTS
jgi:hypothetical protein